jgi:hypothetical protein
MFRKLSVSAVALSLLAAPAMAANTTDTVTLNATVGDYIAITDRGDSTIGDLDISEGSTSEANNNSGQAAGTKAFFEVTSNVNYKISLDWQTWQDAGLAIPAGVPTSFEQANYYNSDADCSIGGIVSLDTDPNVTQNAVVRRPNSGKPPLEPADVFDPGIDTYGVNTEASPNVTNCDGGVAAPGTYSIDVEIMVSKSMI